MTAKTPIFSIVALHSHSHFGILTIMNYLIRRFITYSKIQRNVKIDLQVLIKFTLHSVKKISNAIL